MNTRPLLPKRAGHRRRHRRLERAGTWMGVVALVTMTGLPLASLIATPAQAATNNTYYVGSAGDSTTGASDCTTSGNTDCTLRDAIEAANTDGSGSSDTILFTGLPSPSTITLADGPLSVADTGTLTITGPGGSDLAVSAADDDSGVFRICEGATVTISGLTIEDGDATYGGGVYNDGTVTLPDDTLSNDSAAQGGGVYNDGTATLSDDTLSDDSATASDPAAYFVPDGGGIYNDGTATLTGDTLSNDTASATSEGEGFSGGGGAYNDGTATLTDDTLANDSAIQGGGVYNDGTATLTGDTLSDDSASSTNDFVLPEGGGIYNDGTVTLSDDTLSDDTASSSASAQEAFPEGGGIYNDGTACLREDTLSDDTAFDGGGIYNDGSGTANLTNDTLFGDAASASTSEHGNTEGGGIYNDGMATLEDDTLSDDTAFDGGGIYDSDDDYGTTTIANSVLDSAGCAGTPSPIDDGYNVESDDSCVTGSTDVIESTSIHLATSLAENGSSGPETLAITSSSSAFEVVPERNCTVETDERGDPRPGAADQSYCDAGAFELQVAAPPATTYLSTYLSYDDTSGSYVTVPAGTAVTDNATLYGDNSESATGTVTYDVYSDSECTDLVSPGTAEMITEPGVLPPSAPVTLTTAGTYYWQATYSGDSSNASSTSSCGGEGGEVETVTSTPIAAPITAPIAPPVADPTTLATSLSGGGRSGTSISVPSGTSVEDSATLSGPNAYIATGTVTYDVYSDSGCSTLADAGAPESIIVPGSLPPSAPVTLSAAGTYYWRATYSGGGSNLSSQSGCGPVGEVETVTPVATTLSTSLSDGVASGNSLSVLIGTAVSDTATLAGSGGVPATGTITYDVYSDSNCSTLVSSGSPETITSPGVLPPSAPVAFTTPGTYYWEATYSGDVSHAPFTSTCGAGGETETVTTTPVSSPPAESTALSTSLSGGGVSGTSISVTSGTAVKDSATLSGPSSSEGTGTVTYDVYSDVSCSTLVSAGTPETITTPGVLPPSVAVTLTAAGTYYWQATYSGDVSHAPSSSTCGTKGEVETVTSPATTSKAITVANTTTPGSTKTPSGVTSSPVPVVKSLGSSIGHVSLNATSGAPGDTLTAFGSGCTPGADVKLSVGNRLVGSTTADRTGTFDAPVMLPDVAVGQYSFVARCGPTLTTTLSVVLFTSADPATTTFVVLIFFVLIGFAVVRRQFG